MESAFSRIRQESEGESEEPSHRGLSLRRKREFTPEEKKDASYWEKRRKNNEAAKRSREKRRVNDYMLETRLVALCEENAALRAELLSLKLRYGLLGTNPPYAAHQRCFLQIPPYAPYTASPHLDRERYWEKRVQEPPQLPGCQRPPVTIPTHPSSGFIPTHSFPISRGCAYPLDAQGLLSSSNASMLPGPVFSPLATSHLDLPRLRSRDHRPASDEEGEQQVPANGSASLPHKLRLKNPKAAENKHSRTTAMSPQPICVSD
ncbi:nuclear factor, interleukin 3 regulated, member 4 [Electrophorus electricus]|uniref:BZIP domain-containing protein n=1 Tax=Electrophorus electricus TaxID=8005 RepID=A0A4W4FMZ0_ELEEL|nr:nuclear factor, interleukin 3 regulated, member 4 [Electrophorus electricus]